MGREVALGLLRRGARIAVVDIDERALANVNQMLGNKPSHVTTHRADITYRDAVAALLCGRRAGHRAATTHVGAPMNAMGGPEQT